jgi:hypothetical protein
MEGRPRSGERDILTFDGSVADIGLATRDLRPGPEAELGSIGEIAALFTGCQKHLYESDAAA